MNSKDTTNSINDAMSFMTIYDVGSYIDSYLSKNPMAVAESPVDPGEFYSPLNTATWDYWFVKTGTTYHAFHLERPGHESADYIDVGHAVSDDLKQWRYYGPAVKARKGGWDDLRIATGSTVHKDGIWYLFYTGHSSADSGVGLSVSRDLYRWVKMGVSPVIPSSKKFLVSWKGKEVEANILADPYIYREPVNGWYYMVANASILNYGSENSGAILMLRSKDLLNWDGYKIVAHTGGFVRMETPQIWTQGGKWYLYFGGVRLKKNVDAGSIDPQTVFHNGDTELVSNYIYLSGTIAGEYTEKSWSNLKLPDSKPFYICKILKDAQNRSVMLTTYWGEWKLSKPYAVAYDSDGSVKIS